MEKFKAPEEGQDKLHFLDYWRVIRIRKAIIFTVFCIVLLSSAVFTNFMPEKFRSFARMDVKKDNPDIGLLGGSFGSGNFDPYWMQTQFEIIKSTAVLHKVIEEGRLQEAFGKEYGDGTPMKLDTTYKLLSSFISLSQTRNTSIIKVSVTTKDPDLSKDIANSVVDQYKGFRTSKQKDATLRGVESLKQQETSTLLEIEDLEDAIDAIVDNLEIDDLARWEDTYASTEDPDRIIMLSREETRAAQAYNKLNGIFQSLLQLQANEDELQQVIETVVPDARLTELLRDRSIVETKLVSDRIRLTAQHPDVVSSEAQLQKVNDLIKRKTAAIMTGYKVKTEQAKRDWDIAVTALDTAKSSNRERSKEYREYETAKKNLTRQKRVLESLKLKIQQEEIDVSITREGEVDIIDVAQSELRAVSPSWSLNLVLGGIIGMSIGIGLAFFIEYLDTSVKTIDDVERALQAPVLGVIPQNVGAIIDEGPDSPHAEAYRVLRTNLLFSRKDKTKNTFSVVSGGAGEGKSTTLFNLATIFSQNNERVLVVDSDLRRPSIHKILGISNSLGLTNYLLGQNTIEEVIQTTKLPTLDILPSGKLPSSSMGILNSPQMKELVEILSNRYDYVFFDSPPIMGISDASILASLVGHTVQVIQYRKYPQAMTIRAKQLVSKISNNLAGVVLNNINMSQDSDYYYYSGYYYDYYYSRNEDSDPNAKKDKNKKNGKPAKLASKSRSEKPGSVSDIKQKY